MHSFEIDDNEPEFFPNPLENRDERVLSWQLLESSADLDVALKNQTPIISTEEYYFTNDRLEGVKLPEYIEAILLTRRLEEIEVDFTYRDGCDTADIALKFEISDDSEDCLTVELISPSHSGDHYGCYTLHPGEGHGDESHSISVAEVNQCLISLIYPADNTDFNKFSDLDMRCASLAPNVGEAFAIHATNNNSDKQYAVTASDQTEGSLRFCSNNGDLHLAEISRTVDERLGIKPDGSLIDEKRRITAQIGYGDGKNIGGTSFFEEYVNIPGKQSSIEFSGTREDYELTLEYAQDILGQYQRTDINDIPFSAIGQDELSYEDKHSDDE